MLERAKQKIPTTKRAQNLSPNHIETYLLIFKEHTPVKEERNHILSILVLFSMCK